MAAIVAGPRLCSHPRLERRQWSRRQGGLAEAGRTGTDLQAADRHICSALELAPFSQGTPYLIAVLNSWQHSPTCPLCDRAPRGRAPPMLRAAASTGEHLMPHYLLLLPTYYRRRCAALVLTPCTDEGSPHPKCNSTMCWLPGGGAVTTHVTASRNSLRPTSKWSPAGLRPTRGLPHGEAGASLRSCAAASPAGSTYT